MTETLRAFEILPEHTLREMVDLMVRLIEACGAVLATHFPPGALDRNELPDKLVEI